MATKKYVSLNKLSTFLDNLKNKFSELTHTHTLNDITDYTVDSELSPTSANPVQNKVLDAEFEAISQALDVYDKALNDAQTEVNNKIVGITNDFVPRMYMIDEENGHNREYYIKSSELYETTETSVTIAEGQSFMVRAVPAEDSTSYSSDFSYIDADGLPIAPPVSIAWEDALVTPTVTISGTTASWDAIDGAVKYEYLIGEHCSYGSYGSFANSNNRLFAEMNRGRGTYTRYVLSSSNKPIPDPDPADYARGYTLDTVIQRLGNKSGAHPEYDGHIRVPEEIIVPEGATDNTIDILNSFATSKKYVDTAIGNIEERLATIPTDVSETLKRIDNTTEYDEVYVAAKNNGGTTLYSLTEDILPPLAENTTVEFKAGKGLYATRYPQYIHKYTADDTYLSSESSSVSVSYVEQELSDGSMDYRSVLIKSSGNNNTGYIYFPITNKKPSGNKLVFETDFCLVEAADAMPEDTKDGSKWFMRCRVQDSEGKDVWASTTNNQCLGRFDTTTNKYGFNSVTGATESNTNWSCGEWIHFRAEQIGTDIRIYINDEQQFTLTANRAVTTEALNFIFEMRGWTYSKILVDNTFFGMVDDDWFGKRGIAIPVKDMNGNIMVPSEPINDNHAASKVYVDSKSEILYGICDTASNKKEKIVTISNPDFSLKGGTKVSVKFTGTNTTLYPELNVNNTGNIPIHYNGVLLQEPHTIKYLSRDKVCEFIYDGEYWDLVGYIPDLDSLGITATAEELNKLDGLTATTEEINYIDGVTSNVQEQIDTLSGRVSSKLSTFNSSVAVHQTDTKVAITDVPVGKIYFMKVVVAVIVGEDGEDFCQVFPIYVPNESENSSDIRFCHTYNIFHPTISDTVPSYVYLNFEKPINGVCTIQCQFKNSLPKPYSFQYARFTIM